MTIGESGKMEAYNQRAITFLGVTTGSSQVRVLFPSWARCLGENIELETMDMPLGSDIGQYREYVRSLKSGRPHIIGGLITSHKTALYDSACDLFDVITPPASKLGEIGMVYWKNGNFVGDANDAISTRHAASSLISNCRQWIDGCRSVMVIGGGGAGRALANTFSTEESFGCKKVYVVECDEHRVEALRELIEKWSAPVPIEVICNRGVVDDILRQMSQGSIIINATGLGKDRPGSPVSNLAEFPLNSLVWDCNYRFVEQGDPNFIQIAAAQKDRRNLIISDGWSYFVWGWLVVMSYATDRNPEDYFECFDRIASLVRSKSSHQ